MVADGVGGQEAGEVASQMAIELIKNSVHADKESFVGEYRTEFSRHSNRLLSGIRLANAAIYAAGQKHPDQRQMATTLAAVYLNGDVMTLASVGDSRIYRLRGE